MYWAQQMRHARVASVSASVLSIERGQRGGVGAGACVRDEAGESTSSAVGGLLGVPPAAWCCPLLSAVSSSPGRGPPPPPPPPPPLPPPPVEASLQRAPSRSRAASSGPRSAAESHLMEGQWTGSGRAVDGQWKGSGRTVEGL